MHELIRRERDDYKLKYDDLLQKKMFGFNFDESKDSNEENTNVPEVSKNADKAPNTEAEELTEKKTVAKRPKGIKKKEKTKHQTEKIDTSKTNISNRKENKKLDDESNKRIKKEMIKMIEQLRSLNSEDKNRFKEILDMLDSFGLKLEITLSRILAWNYFSEIERVKEKHKTEMFILNKQIEGLKSKLIDVSSRRFKEFQGVSITIDGSGDDGDSDFNYK